MPDEEDLRGSQGRVVDEADIEAGLAMTGDGDEWEWPVIGAGLE